MEDTEAAGGEGDASRGREGLETGLLAASLFPLFFPSDEVLATSPEAPLLSFLAGLCVAVGEAALFAAGEGERPLLETGDGRRCRGQGG